MEKPDDSLNNSEGETEIKSRSLNEAKFRFSTFGENLIEKLFVGCHVGDDHMLDVEDLVDVLFDIVHERSEESRRFFHRGQNNFFTNIHG